MDFNDIKKPTTNRRGKKIKMTKIIADQICADIARGIPIIYATQAAGLGHRTHYDYIKKGEKVYYEVYNGIKQENLLTEEEKLFHDYYNNVKISEAKGVVDLMSTIREHSRKSWQAAAWILERTRQDEFALQQNIVSRKEVDFKISIETINSRIKKLKENEKIELEKGKDYNIKE